ncbi:MAG: substrate-binding domain-containing protein [Clostridiales Family XIII bacterium]|jgi:simple sugar transport system substrate-binding protein|nr:substrate-binding domain-containing protein [Clostridiales Family XIII bacterium]
MLIFCVALTVALVLSGCNNTSGGGTDTAASGGSAAPVAEEGGSGGDAAAPAVDTSEKPFAGKKIIFFPGGGEGDVFSAVVYNGAEQARKDLGCDVEYVWSDWDNNKMVTQLKEAIARKPDAICIMGHPGDDAYKQIVDEAEAQGIVITSQNTSLPELEEAYKTAGFGYVGQELYASGELLAKEAWKRAGLASGDKVLLWGLEAQPGRGQRTLGAHDALNELGANVIYIEISDAINSDPSQGTPVITAALAKDPDIKMVITDHGSLTSTLGTFLQAAGKQPGEIFGAGFDLSGDTSEAITAGWVGAVLDQQQYLQGYLPILQACLTTTYGFAGLHIDTGAAIIDKDNIEDIKPLAQAGIR